MTMHKALYPRNDIDRLYVSRKAKGSRVVSIGDCVDASILGLEYYIKKDKEKLITAASSNIGNISTNRKQQKLGSRNRKKKKYIDISRNKLAKSHTRRHGHGYDRKT